MTAESSLQQRFGLTVTPQNVLGVRAVVLQEAQDLDKMLRDEREQAILQELGRDPVSRDMASAFNEVTMPLLARADEHVAALFELGDELAAAAKAYGHTEDDIAASLTPRSLHTRVSQLSTPFREVAGLSQSASRLQPGTVSELLTGGRS
jgi:hypothetical protein